MKPQRLIYAPTRSRRLNEMLGLIVLVAAGLLLLALVSYTPSDPSFNTVGGGVGGRLAHNWTGLVGAYVADLLLQTVGIAIFFVPLAMIRIGISWMRSQRVGSTKTKLAGIALSLIFAPALIALMPGQLLWRHALPIAGIEGTILAGGLMHFVNYPGSVILCSLMVALSLYLTTSFLLANAGAWFTAHFGFLQSLSDRYAAWKSSVAVRRTKTSMRRSLPSARLRRLRLGGRRLARARTRRRVGRCSRASLDGLGGESGGRMRTRTRALGMRRLAGSHSRCGRRCPADGGGRCSDDGTACGGGSGGAVCCAIGGCGGSAAECAG